MKNKLIDLNNHLFAQLERLNDDSLTSEKLTFETERAKAMSMISKAIIDNAALRVEASKAVANQTSLVEIPSYITAIVAFQYIETLSLEDFFKKFERVE